MVSTNEKLFDDEVLRDKLVRMDLVDGTSLSIDASVKTISWADRYMDILFESGILQRVWYDKIVTKHFDTRGL